MKLPALGEIHEYIPIPKIFHSFLSEEKFSKCSVCNLYLLKEGTNYLIEKGFKGSEVIFEYAMCNSCRINMAGQLSVQSRKLIEHYFDERVDLANRREQLIEDYDQSVEPWITECLVQGNQRETCESYQICAECIGEHLVFTYLPFMLSSNAIEDLEKLLSKKTRDKLDDFTRDVLNSPVHLEDIPILM